MSNFSADLDAVKTKVKSFIADLGTDLPGFLAFVKALSGIAAEQAPLYGPAAPEVLAAATAAGAISTGLSAALAAHQASGSTPMSAAALGSAALQVVATSGAIKDQGTIQALNEAATAITTLSPEIATAAATIQAAATPAPPA